MILNYAFLVLFLLAIVPGDSWELNEVQCATTPDLSTPTANSCVDNLHKLYIDGRVKRPPLLFWPLKYWSSGCILTIQPIKESEIFTMTSDIHWDHLLLVATNAWARCIGHQNLYNNGTVHMIGFDGSDGGIEVVKIEIRGIWEPETLRTPRKYPLRGMSNGVISNDVVIHLAPVTPFRG
jgi:hypothetical protein